MRYSSEKKWSKDFINFDFVARNLKENNHGFADFGKISSEKKNIVYKIIAKDKYFIFNFYY